MEQIVITEGLPEGWLIRRERRGSRGGEPLYWAYQWRNSVRKPRWFGFRTTITLTGWFRTTIAARNVEDAKALVLATARQMGARL